MFPIQPIVAASRQGELRDPEKIFFAPQRGARLD
jgi:hypothetical protein